MGINWNKQLISHRPMISPGIMENLDEVGSIYLVIHRPKTEANDNESKRIEKQLEKTSHFCVAIDIPGSSTVDEFVATHYDLCVKSPTNYTTYIDSTLKYHSWDYYHLVRKIGQIPLNEIRRFDMPHQFAIDLSNRLSQEVYSSLFRANNGPHWSSIFNCQTITRLSIQFLGYQFPDDIEMIRDIVPTMFDIDVNDSLITDQTSQT